MGTESLISSPKSENDQVTGRPRSKPNADSASTAQHQQQSEGQWPVKTRYDIDFQGEETPASAAGQTGDSPDMSAWAQMISRIITRSSGGVHRLRCNGIRDPL